jgi:hypothetical protein
MLQPILVTRILTEEWENRSILHSRDPYDAFAPDPSLLNKGSIEIEEQDSSIC